MRKRRLDLDGFLHWLTQRTIFLWGDCDAPGASGFELDDAGRLATLDFAGAFRCGQFAYSCGLGECCGDQVSGT